MAVRESWTDERLDDLNHRVDDLGRRMDEGFREVNTRIDGLQRTMIHGAIALSAAIVAGFGGMAGLLAVVV